MPILPAYHRLTPAVREALEKARQVFAEPAWRHLEQKWPLDPILKVQSSEEEHRYALAQTGVRLPSPSPRGLQVLELGFGKGLNLCLFLARWTARSERKEDPLGPARYFVFHSVEPHPPAAAELLHTWRQETRPPLGLPDGAQASIACLPPIDAALQALLKPTKGGVPQWVEVLAEDRGYRLPGLHRFELSPGFFFDLQVGDPLRILARIDRSPHVVLWNAFARQGDASLADIALLPALRRLLPEDALVLSASTSAGLQAELLRRDFEVDCKNTGEFKPDRLEARYRPRGVSRRLARAIGTRDNRAPNQEQEAHAKEACAPAQAQSPAGQQMLILGAGLAGRTMAEEALRAGWSLSLVDPRTSGAVEASALPAYLEHLHVSSDDNPLARLSRAALLLARRSGHDAPIALGRKQVLSTEEEAKWECALADLASRADRDPNPWDEMIQLHRHTRPAQLHFPRSAACGLPPLSPGLQSLALAASIERQGAQWQLRDARHAPVAAGAVVIVACAQALELCAPELAQHLVHTPGSSLVLELDTLSPEHPVWRMDRMVSGQVHAVRLAQSGCTGSASPAFLQVGSLYIEAAHEQVHATLLEGLRTTLGLDNAALAQLRELPYRVLRGVRCSVADHLPMIGPLPDLQQITKQNRELQRDARRVWPRCEGAYTLCALGSRGALWARLGARLILDHLAGLPPLLEKDLVAAIDPARFLMRQLRRGLGHNPQRHGQSTRESASDQP